MKDLVERILKVRGEIAELNRSKRAIQKQLDEKQLLLEDLEILTVNQLDLFKEDGEKETM